MKYIAVIFNILGHIILQSSCFSQSEGQGGIQCHVCIQIVLKQGRIHGRISCVRLGRISDAKTAQKLPKKTKQMRYQLTNRPIDEPTNQLTDQPTDRYCHGFLLAVMYNHRGLEQYHACEDLSPLFNDKTSLEMRT